MCQLNRAGHGFRSLLPVLCAESLLRLDGIQYIDISIAQATKVHIEVSGGGPTAEQLKQAVERGRVTTVCRRSLPKGDEMTMPRMNGRI